MITDMDRYYTPIELAESILASNFHIDVDVCVDSTCGIGNLLSAANNIYGNVQCCGLDRDKNAIAALRRKNPSWKLSATDFMKLKDAKNNLVIDELCGSDLLLLNPPFSHGKKKHVSIKYDGLNIQSSIAMAHILRSLEYFCPRNGAMVIAPESILYSDTDCYARSAINQKYYIKVISELDIKTFSGARVRSTALKILPRKNVIKKIKLIDPKQEKSITNIIRGALPVHDVRYSYGKTSVPFIHSTDLKNFAQTKTILSSKRTCSNRKGRVKGSLILLPRVGLPNKEYIKPLYFQEEIQLSDCVIAISFKTKKNANIGSRLLRDNINELIGLYRGTGARYITITRLQKWLASKSIIY